MVPKKQKTERGRESVSACVRACVQSEFRVTESAFCFAFVVGAVF